MNLDHVNVEGLMVYSPMDDSGQQTETMKHFGLYQTDANDPKQRTPKASAALFRNLVVANAFKPNSDVIGGMPHEDDFIYGKFPDGFIWSTATASYQIEGGVKEGGISICS